MRYGMLICVDETAPVNPQERARRVAAFESVLDEMRTDGVLLASERLHPTDTATTVRCWDGGDIRPLGGYSLITAGDIDEAVALAKGCPFVGQGGGVEVGRLADPPSGGNPA